MHARQEIPQLARTQPPPDLIPAALVRLQQGTAAIKRIRSERPRLVFEALLNEVPPDRVAGAIDMMDMVEFRTAVSHWASRMRERGTLPEQIYVAIMNIVFGRAS